MPRAHSTQASWSNLGPKVPVNLDTRTAPMERPSSYPLFRSQRLKVRSHPP